MGNLSYTNIEDFKKFLDEYGGSSGVLFRANSSQNQSLTNAGEGQIITLNNIEDTDGFSYSNGVLLFLKSGFYSIDVQLHLDATSGQNAHFESWFEYSVLAQPTLPFPNSGRFLEFRERTEGFVSYSSKLMIDAGTSFALIGRSKLGSVQLLSSSLDNGLSAPSVVVSIIKI